MISQPGDKRAALIAALVAFPAACLVTMVVHTFVPIPKQNVITGYTFFECIDAPAVDPASEDAPKGPGFHKKGMPPRGEFRKGPGPRGALHKGPGPKGEFRKGPGPRGAFRKPAGGEGPKAPADGAAPRTELLKKIASLTKQRLELLKKDPGTAPRELIRAEADCLLCEAAILRSGKRIRTFGPAASDLAVRAVAANKIAELDKAALAANKVKPDTALKSEIASLMLALQLQNSRISRNPDWQKAFEAYGKNPSAETLKGLIEVEGAAMAAPRHR
ncbi:MAG: hypothetical protein IJS01_09780 [Lentisphaeria bacterium]|nr:hypothetical protein [Lentisphaeria bacterium]